MRDVRRQSMASVLEWMCDRVKISKVKNKTKQKKQNKILTNDVGLREYRRRWCARPLCTCQNCHWNYVVVAVRRATGMQTKIDGP